MPKTFPAMAALAAVTIAIGAGTAASGPLATSYKLQATLTVKQEVPRPADAIGAHGLFAATIALHGATGTLSWRLTFSHLSGPALAAHIHFAPKGKAGPIIIPLCGPCKSGAHGSFKGPIGVNSAFLKAFLAGRTYTNVHTKKNAAGEIRGQIQATKMT